MPWTAEDAVRKTHKADSPIKRRQWSEVANSVLSETGDDATAIREANGVIKKHSLRKAAKQALNR